MICYSGKYLRIFTFSLIRITGDFYSVANVNGLLYKYSIVINYADRFA